MKLYYVPLLCVFLMSASCPRRYRGIKLKVYVSDPIKGGLVRSQSSELIPYADTTNYRCLSKPDFNKLIDYCFNPNKAVFENIRRQIRGLKTLSARKKAIANVTYNINSLIEYNLSTTNQ